MKIFKFIKNLRASSEDSDFTDPTISLNRTMPTPKIEVSGKKNYDEQGINSIFNFLRQDYELKGYSDALLNPDENYKSDNLKLILLDFRILAQQVLTYYEDLTKELDLHIKLRARAGLIDLVQKLESRKLMVADHKEKVFEILKNMPEESGINHRIGLSYQRGFLRGLNSVTQSTVLNKKI